eukprot:TRINITY_DN67893_c0_g1_i1.p1 TRINITY_DN67893_c0_g1~~TRINITY_DN67893_c0_g1_i1.p1  ORF type:complete len:205 (-),score=21.38 TRINITY_DN67893_c0_g1_i1:146-736(-)
MRTKAVSLTHVVYDADDKLSLIFAILSLVPIAILVITPTVLISSRRIAPAFFLALLLLNECLNLALKHTIKEARPSKHGDHRVDFGMPSSHSQFMGFTAAYLSLALFENRHPRRALAAILLFALAFGVATSRVYLSYHTVPQVCVGLSLGTAAGYLGRQIHRRWIGRFGKRLQRTLEVTLAAVFDAQNPFSETRRA